MPFKEIDIEVWAKKSGVSIQELREKRRLIEVIVEARKKKQLTQDELAEMVGVSQSRIAQIENGVKMDKISIDILLKILSSLGFNWNIKTIKQAA